MAIVISHESSHRHESAYGRRHLHLAIHRHQLHDPKRRRTCVRRSVHPAARPTRESGAFFTLVHCAATQPPIVQESANSNHSASNSMSPCAYAQQPPGKQRTSVVLFITPGSQPTMDAHRICDFQRILTRHPSYTVSIRHPHSSTRNSNPCDAMPSVHLPRAITSFSRWRIGPESRGCVYWRVGLEVIPYATFRPRTRSTQRVLSSPER